MLKDIAKQFTGGNVEEKVSEYSDIYGEVLLGMHRDLQKHTVTIKNHERSMQQGLASVHQIQSEMTKNVARVEELLAEMKRCMDDAHKYSEAASIASQTALNGVAAAELAAERQEKQLGKLRNEFQKLRTRMVWAFGSTTALLLIGVITWILHLHR